MFHKVLRASIISALMLLLVSGAAFAATDFDTHNVTINIDEIAVIAVNAPTPAVSFTISAPTAGNEGAIPVIAATNNDKRLLYTSIVGTSNSVRRVTAQITTGSVPAGLKLYVTAGTAAAGAMGSPGLTAGEKELITTSAADVLSAIGSCYTTLAGGSDLTYRLSIDNMANLVAITNNSLTVTYTLTEDAP